jgi:hypothetical protein
VWAGISCSSSPSSLLSSVSGASSSAGTTWPSSVTGAKPGGVTHINLTTRERPGRISGCKASKYGVSSGSGKRRDSASARQALHQASSKRGTTTHSIKVPAYRWIHAAAVACAGAPGPTRSGATSGTPMPVSKLAGASSVFSSVWTADTSRKVLCQPAR